MISLQDNALPAPLRQAYPADGMAGPAPAEKPQARIFHENLKNLTFYFSK